MGSFAFLALRRTCRVRRPSMPDREVVPPVPVESPHEKDGHDRELRHDIPLDDAAVEERRGRHVAEHEAGSTFARAVCRRPVDQVDVVERELPGLEDVVLRLRGVDLTGIQDLVQRQLLVQVCVV